jgi:hypothetical protein
VDAVVRGLGNSPRDRAPPNWPGTYVPNLSEWRLGDIVLVEADGPVGSMIRFFQSLTGKLLVLVGSRWSHAAIYVGNGMVIDACFPQGVGEQSLWTYCEKRRITLRRLANAAIPTADVAKIATMAKPHVGEPYAALQPVLAKLGWAPNPNPAALYCSTFVGLVVTEATTVDLSADPRYQPLLPATLAGHHELTPVPLTWRNI